MVSGSQDGLFDESLVERVVPDASLIEAGAGIHKRFRSFDPGAVMMVPPSLDEWLPEVHLARFVADLVESELDLTYRRFTGEVAALCDQARDPTRSVGENLSAFLRGFVDYMVAHAALARTLAAIVEPAAQSYGGGELESTVADLLTRAAAGAIRDDVAVGAVMIVLHGIGSATDRPLWASEAREAVELLLAGLARL